MIEQRRGKVINMSSQAGAVALEGHGSYAASKGGLNMITKVMARSGANTTSRSMRLSDRDYHADGNASLGRPQKPGPMLAKIPLRRFGQPVEVADLVLFLASPASDLITGEAILIDGGYTAI